MSIFRILWLELLAALKIGDIQSLVMSDIKKRKYNKTVTYQLTPLFPIQENEANHT